MAEKLLDAVWRRLRNFYADPSWCWTDEVLLSTEEEFPNTLSHTKQQRVTDL